MPKPAGKNGERNLIADRLRMLREECGYSQRALAGKLQLMGIDMDKNVITRIETNRRYVTDIELRAFSELFGVSCGYLIGVEKTVK